MPTYTLRPNANWNNDSLFTISGGSASVHAALADDSDSTFITRTSNTVPAFYEAEFGTTTIAATERVVSVNLRARLSVGTVGQAQLSLGSNHRQKWSRGLLLSSLYKAKYFCSCRS
jgi:hypothetical protein